MLRPGAVRPLAGVDFIVGEALVAAEGIREAGLPAVTPLRCTVTRSPATASPRLRVPSASRTLAPMSSS